MLKLYEGTYDAQKKLNQFEVLDTIRKTDVMSCPEIAEKLKLSNPTVINIVKEFVDRKVLLYAGEAQSRGGRRAQLVKLNESAGYVIGVDFEIPHITAVLTDLKMNVIKKSKAILPKNADDTVNYLVKCTKELLNNVKINKENIMGIGISLPGLIDRQRGISIIIDRPIKWRNVDVKGIFEREFHFPVVILNDANAMALGEKMLGSHSKGLKDMIYVALRSGFGSAVFLDGTLYQGQRGLAGNIGHVTVNNTGPECSCGNHGCIEVYCNERILEKKVKDAVSKKNIKDNEDVFEAARKGNLHALEIVRETGEYMGIGIATLVDLFDIRDVVVGGTEVSVRGGQMFLDIIREKAKKCLFFSSEDSSIDIRLGDIEEDAGALGAAIMVIEESFRKPEV